MKKLLFVAYIFPPTATTGVHRSAKFAQFLPEFGWKPTVLTTRNCGYPQRDQDSIKHIPSDVEVVRVSAIESPHIIGLGRRLLSLLRLEHRFGKALEWRINRLFHASSVPDIHAPWARRAIPVAESICARQSVDAVMTTSWPYSSHLIGLHLSRRFGLPWLADFRDPWLDNAAYDVRSGTTEAARDAGIERRFVTQATSVIVTSSATRTGFQTRYPEMSEGHFKLVRNGYDPDHLSLAPAPTSGPLRIAYIGAFYRNRSPVVLARAVRNLALEGVSPTDLQFLFIGNMGGTEDTVTEHGVAQFFSFRGPRPTSVCYREASDCQVFWLLQHEEDHLCVPGKAYEYLAANRWILASAPLQSEVASILSGAGRHVLCVPPNDIDSTAAALRELLATHRLGQLQVDCSKDYAESFTRKAQTKILADILDSTGHGA